MLRPVARRSCLWPVPALLLLFSSLLAPVASAQTGGTLFVPGIVVDEVGAAVAGARVTVSDEAGAVIQTTTSDAAGTFSRRDLAPGTYSVPVEMTLFVATTQRVKVTASGPASSLRAALRAGGFADSIVVTARRVETRMAETPQKVEIIDATDIDRSVSESSTGWPRVYAPTSPSVARSFLQRPSC